MSSSRKNKTKRKRYKSTILPSESESPSLSVWTQRAGRAGRSPELHARAILLVEKSMFKRQKKRKRGKVKAKSTREPESSDSDDSSSESGADEPARAPVQSANGITSQDSQTAQPTQTAEPADGLDWGKAVDPILREYISTSSAAVTWQMITSIIRLVALQLGNVATTRALNTFKNRNSNGKRAMTYGEGPKTRRKDHLKSARSALDRWRINTSLDVYGNTSLTPERAKTLQELRDLVPDWAFADEHIPDIMRTLSRVDEQERAQLQRDKELRAADRVEKPSKTAWTSAKGTGAARNHLCEHNFLTGNTWETCYSADTNGPCPDLSPITSPATISVCHDNADTVSSADAELPAVKRPRWRPRGSTKRSASAAPAKAKTTAKPKAPKKADQENIPPPIELADSDDEIERSADGKVRYWKPSEKTRVFTFILGLDTEGERRFNQHKTNPGRVYKR
ncbi:hypothetical protein B0H10DRAFT_2221271 [Mycena sp. CBHHK59/15]|nr:hypothetical protein B0H10DRAFT_2221271 [Mycena sp. CBHHK59/15]